jgi:hypothetical protein
MPKISKYREAPLKTYINIYRYELYRDRMTVERLIGMRENTAKYNIIFADAPSYI